MLVFSNVAVFLEAFSALKTCCNVLSLFANYMKQSLYQDGNFKVGNFLYFILSGSGFQQPLVCKI